MTQRERYEKIFEWFEREVPVAESELNYSNPYELLVAVILSAQCTDKRVNIVTPSLFKQYPTPWDMAKSNPQEIYTYIRSISYPNNKATNLHKMSQMLIECFDGIVPNNIEMLQELPGVGRKTANVVSAVAFNQPAMPVDTHVFRVSNRLGLTNNAKTPLECEKILVKNIPQAILSKAHHWLLLHGRYTCTARKPHCEQCGLIPYCKSAKKRTK